MPGAERVFDDHQRRAIRLLGGVLACLEVGMTAADVRDLAEAGAGDLGFDRWFHRPQVTIEAAGRRDLRPTVREGALVRVDVAPATGEAFGDVGATLAFGVDEPEVVERARGVVLATCGYASRWKTFGELFVFATAWANNRQAKVAARSVGHACLPPEGLLATGYAASARAATLLRRHQGRMLNPRRLDGVYAIRIPLAVGGRVACFEEMISVGDDGRRVLGRDDIEEIGRYSGG